MGRVARPLRQTVDENRHWEEKTSQGGVGLRGRSLGTAVLELAMLAALENDRRYADQASAILLAATQQTDPAALAASDSDLMAGDAAHAFAVGLDWLWPWLDAAQRETLWREVRDYGEWIYRNSLVKPWGAENYSREAWNWNGVLHGSLGLCALWTGNADWLRRAEERSVAHLHTALDPSGLPWEGFTYACYGNLDVFPFLEALKLRTGRDRLGDDEGLKAFLENFRTLWIPGLAENVPWNQSSPIPVPIGMYWNLLARYRSPEAAWWWQRVYGARAAGGSFGAAIASQGASLPYCLLWCDPTIPAHAPGSEELFRRFDSGLVVARSGWGDDDSLVVFSAIRGIPNSWHHADQGSFSFYYRGEGFAVDAGAGFKPGLQHNTLLFDGVAQDAAGGPEHDPVDLTLCENRAGALTLSSDLTAAYRKRAGLDSYTRQLLYVRGESPCVVIHDRWQCASPPREIAFVLMTSVGNRIEAASDAGGWILRGANRRAACTIRFSAPAVVLEQDVPGRGVRRRPARCGRLHDDDPARRGEPGRPRRSRRS